MAHTCPECGQLCHCGGDIDDIDFGESASCIHYTTPGCLVDDDPDDDINEEEG